MSEPAVEQQSTAAPAERAAVPATVGVAAFAPQTLLLQLQRTAGNHAVARAVAGRRSLQRQALDPAEILAAVESSKFLKQKLESSTTAQQRVKPNRERMRGRVEAILKRYEAMFGGAATDNAMMLTLAVDGAAAVIADELYDPSLKGRISEVLLTVYGPKIAAALTKKHGLGKQEARDAVALARTLGSGDPVALYMHEEMRLEHAAFEIAELAKRANLKPDAMFDLLLQRYQAELGSYTLEELEGREHKGPAASPGAYLVTEATGEVSGAFFKSLFGEAVAKDPKKQPAKRDAGGLTFTTEAAAKLDRLRKAVEAGAGKPLPATADERRKQHFEDLTKSDKAIASGREARVKAWLTSDPWKLDDAKADRVIAKLKAGLPGLPLTLTVWGKSWFGDRQSPKVVKPDYTPGPATVPEQKLKELIGVKGTKAKARYGSEKLAYSGKYEHELYGFERGETYLRFRRWKDQLMTQSLGFTPEELPVFGAVNVNWATAWGTEGYAGDKTMQELAALKRQGVKLTAAQEQRLAEGRAEQKRQDQIRTAGKDIGINYYGDTHFLLDAAKIAGRVVYTATDHGQPHVDPFLAFADLMLPPDKKEAYGGTTYRPDVTRLKPAGVHKPGVQMDIINAILDPTNAPVVKRGLPFEIQIFGGIDIRTDVKAIYVSPGAPDGVYENAQAWAKANAGHVTVHQIAVPDSARVPVDATALKGAASPEEKARTAAGKV